MDRAVRCCTLEHRQSRPPLCPDIHLDNPECRLDRCRLEGFGRVSCNRAVGLHLPLQRWHWQTIGPSVTRRLVSASVRSAPKMSSESDMSIYSDRKEQNRGTRFSMRRELRSRQKYGDSLACGRDAESK